MNAEANNVVDCMTTSEWLDKLQAAEQEDAAEGNNEEDGQTADWVILVDFAEEDCNGRATGMFGPFMADCVDCALLNLTAREDVRGATVWNKEELEDDEDDYDDIDDLETDDWDDEEDEEWEEEVQEAIDEAVSQEGDGYVWSDEVVEEPAVESPVEAVEVAPAEEAVPVEETAPDATEASVEAVESVVEEETEVADESIPEEETDTPL